MAKSSPKPPQFVAPAPKGMVPALTTEAQTEAERARFSTGYEGGTSRLTADGRRRLSEVAAVSRRDAVAPSQVQELDLDAAVFEEEDEGEEEGIVLVPPTDDAVAQVPKQTAPTPDLTLTPTSDEDIDRLWDWLRNPADKDQSFLGMQLTTSRQLTQVVQGLVHQHYFESIYWQDTQHLGFVALAPVLPDLGYGILHMYLRLEVRGMLKDLLGPVLEQLARRQGGAYNVAVHSTDAALSRLHRLVLTPLGFTEHTLFVR